MTLKEQCPGADTLFAIIPQLVEINAAIFEVNIVIFAINMTNHSQYITKKKFQRQLKVPSWKRTLLCNMFIVEKYFTLFLGETY